MEILCAYIRENAPASQAAILPEEPAHQELMHYAEYMEKIERWKRNCNIVINSPSEKGVIVGPRPDVQTALTVIGRRSLRQREFEARKSEYNSLKSNHVSSSDFYELDFPEGPGKAIYSEWMSAQVGYRLNLSRANLQCADFRGGNFEKSIFTESRMEGAKLHLAVFDYSSMSKASLAFSNISGASFKTVMMAGVRMEGVFCKDAVIRNSYLNGSRISHAQMYFCNLSGSDMRRTILLGSSFDRADLSYVDFGRALFNRTTFLANANLRCACFRDTDVSSIMVTSEKLKEAYGDASVIRQSELVRAIEAPQHWSTEILTDEEFYKSWRLWQTEAMTTSS